MWWLSQLRYQVVAFVDLENIEIDTKIAVIGAYTADLWTIA